MARKQKPTAGEIVDKMLQGLFDDVKGSYRLALEASGVDPGIIQEVEDAVEDYVSNHWF